MTPPPTLAEDHHVHSTFSNDAVSTVADNVAAARARGLRTLCLTDHVRSDTTWAPEFARAVEEVADGAGLTVLRGVEVKILDRAGRLDLPERLPTLDRVLIADHQYPDVEGPASPAEVRRRIDGGELAAAEVIETLVLATARAMGQTERPQLAHLFSLLPKVGLDEAQVGADQLRLLAEAARDTGALVEVNEKWRCPGQAALAAFRAAGVPLVASTDSHRAEDVGVYRWVTEQMADDPR